MNKLSVIIPAYGNQHALDMSLATIKPQLRFVKPVNYKERWEVIVVDDGSDPPLRIPDWCCATRIPRESSHRGSSAAKNFGAARATGKYLSFCDSDILHLPDAFESLLNCIRTWEEEGDSSVLLNTMRVGLPDGYKDKYIADVEKLSDKCRSANLLQDEDIDTPAVCYEQNESLIRADFFHSVGGYDEYSFPSWGFNNQDLDLRVALSGGRVSSAIRRVSTGKRLHCFHQFHENHCDRQRAQAEFRAKWGSDWSDQYYWRTVMMISTGGLPKRKPTLQEAECR